MKSVQDAIERLWDFIDKLDINTFGKSTAFSFLNTKAVLKSQISIQLAIILHGNA